MTSPERMPHVTLETLDLRLDHLLVMLQEMREQLRSSASKSELEDLRAQVRALETRLRAVEDDRTAARAILAIISVLGLSGVGVFLKWILQG